MSKEKDYRDVYKRQVNILVAVSGIPDRSIRAIVMVSSPSPTGKARPAFSLVENRIEIRWIVRNPIMNRIIIPKISICYYLV